MPGMSTGQQVSTSLALATAFHRLILHQWFIILGVVVMLFAAWNILRLAALKAQASEHSGPMLRGPFQPREPGARRFLRITFGGLWLFDALLQSQPAMPASLANTVIDPVAKASPDWAMELSRHAIVLWNSHPVTMAAAVFWLQVGLGLWLVSASRGALSRLGGYASAIWALVIWIFAEVFGGLFTPGYSWLFGAPGAALLYLGVGILVGLPDRFWRSPRIGLEMIRVIGAFLITMAIIQAWPHRGFWHGRTDVAPFVGTLPGMLRAMEKTPQPRLLKSLVGQMAALSTSHGFAVNLSVVLVLGVLGFAFFSCSNHDGEPRVYLGWFPLLPIVVVYVAISLLVWVFIQDLGFLGGMGTDPNSMIPFALALIGATLAARMPSLTENFDHAQTPISARAPFATWRFEIVGDPVQSIRRFITLGALLITCFGVIPMIGTL